MSERKSAKTTAASNPGQAHLPPATPTVQDESAHIDKLVSLTYDSNPDVRRRAALELSKIDDPRAVFALLELGADKDPTVQDLARSSLNNFKGEEKETLVSLEKIFEARQEGRPPTEDMAMAKQKLMPSLERLFSKNKAVRDRMLPSIEKLFSWIPAGPGASASSASRPSASSEYSSAQNPSQSAAPASAQLSSNAPSLHSRPPTSRQGFQDVATAHLSDEQKELAQAQDDASLRQSNQHSASSHQTHQQSNPHQTQIRPSPLGEDEDDDDSNDAVPASVPIEHSSARDPLAGVESIRSQSRHVLEQAEEDVGVPAHLRSADELRRMRTGQQAGYANPVGQSDSSQPRPRPSLSASSPSMQQRMEEATNFPVPEYLQPKAPSPTSVIPSMMDEEKAEEFLPEEGVRMPKHALYYYKLAYAIALTPGIKASEVKKEKERIIKESKQDIELAFKLAVERTTQEGIESLSGLKPGMKKLSTLPLEVLDNMVVSVPHGKKLLAYNRLLLSDGKHQLPLYVPPPRADGIKPGDLLSLRDAFVDYWVKANPAPGGQPGELVLMLGKNGQLIVTK